MIADRHRSRGDLPGPSAELQRLVRLAARGLARSGLAHAYGHCSARLDDERFLVCASRPMGLIGPGEPGTVCAISGELPAGVFGEVGIHRAIYAARPDVGGICRTQPFHVMALSSAGEVPLPRHCFGAYFPGGVRMWDDVRLVRDAATAAAVADVLGDAWAVLLRGNGAVVCGTSIEEAAVLTWYLEDAARVELVVRAAGFDRRLTPEEVADRQVWTGQIRERMWEYLTAADPEAGARAETPPSRPSR